MIKEKRLYHTLRARWEIDEKKPRQGGEQSVPPAVAELAVAEVLIEILEELKKITAALGPGAPPGTPPATR